jgi:hypothetical protein
MAILAALAAQLLAVFRRSPEWKSLGIGLASAGAYGVAFHLVYAVGFGHTYSLSGFYSWAGALSSILLGALAGFLAAWMVDETLTRWIGRISGGVLRMAGRLLGVLAIPVAVHFFWNTPLVAWTIPEMWTAFLGEMALLSIFLVAAYALAFEGITRVLHRRRPSG